MNKNRSARQPSLRLTTLLILAATCFGILSAPAISRRHDVPDQEYKDYGATFSAVCFIEDQIDGGSGTGTLISSTRVITAAHVVDLNNTGQSTHGTNFKLRFGADFNAPVLTINPSDIASVLVCPQYVPGGVTRHDMALIILKQPITNPAITPIPVVAVPPADFVGKECAMVGYGEIGTGLIFPANPSFDTFRRAAKNIVDCAIDAGTLIIHTDFDAPAGTAGNPPNRCGTAVALPLEGSTGPGDSGGPLIVDFGGSLGLGVVGTHSEGFNQGLVASEYGCDIYWASVMDPLNRAFLEANGVTLRVPPPTSITVGNNNDSGDGSLRKAIADIADSGTISFAANLNGAVILTGSTLITPDNKKIGIDASMLANGITLSGQNTHRVLMTGMMSDVTFKRVTFANGLLASVEGAGVGAGFYAKAGFTDCTFRDNSSRSAAAMDIPELTEVTLSGCSFLRNTGTGTDSNLDFSGAVFNAGKIIATNCTFQGNTTMTGGGAIFNDAFGELTLRHCTIAQNTAANEGGGVWNKGTMTLENTLIASNQAPKGPDLSTAAGWTSTGVNLIGNSADAAGLAVTDLRNVNAGIGSLGNNGGATQTVPISGSSAALDKAGASNVGVDQRGVVRPIGAGPDIGAYETSEILEPTDFAGWAVKYIPVGKDRSFGGDAEGDGLSNGYEYAHRLDPAAIDRNSAPGLLYRKESNGISHMQFSYDGTSPRADIIHRIERGSDLAGWKEIYRDDPRVGTRWAVPGVETSSSVAAGRTTLLVSDTQLGDGRAYWRSRVELIAPGILTPVTVSNNSDTGAGSLRQAIADVPNHGVIRFAPTITSIALKSTITITGKSISIDASKPLDAAFLLVLDGENLVRPFMVAADAGVWMNRIEVRNGRTSASGGAILSLGTLRLSRCRFASNTAPVTDEFGGAIENSGTLLAVDTTFENNTAARGGGAVDNYKDGGTAVAHFSRCTFLTNKSMARHGGALLNSGEAFAINCIFSGNQAQGTGLGGAILNDTGVPLVLRHCTITGNSAAGGFGGGIDADGSVLTLENTVVAGNTGGNVQGTFTARGVNLLTGNPNLGAFGAGGMVPQAGSPAINAATVLNTTPLGDWKQGPRIIGSAPDIGASEAP